MGGDDRKEPHAGRLAFFGRMAADVSHEFGNRLATINEKTGLVEDLAAAAEKGRPLDAARVKALARDIGREVRRADAVCRHLNRFAHSADRPRQRADLAEVLGTMAALVERRAAARRVAVRAQGAPGVPVDVDLVLLEHLIFQCLAWAFEHEPSGTIVISAIGRPDGSEVSLRGAPFARLREDLPGPLAAALAELPATLDPRAAADEIVLHLPAAGAVGDPCATTHGGVQ